MPESTTQEGSTVRKPRASKSSQAVAAAFTPNDEDSFGSSLDDAAIDHRFRLISGRIVRKGNKLHGRPEKRRRTRLLADRTHSGEQEARGPAGDRNEKSHLAQDEARLEEEWDFLGSRSDRRAVQYTTSDNEALFVTLPPPSNVNQKRRRVSAQLHEQIIELPRRAEKRHLNRTQAGPCRASVRQEEQGGRIVLVQDEEQRLKETARLGGERLSSIWTWLDAVVEEADDEVDYVLISDDD